MHAGATVCWSATPKLRWPAARAALSPEMFRMMRYLENTARPLDSRSPVAKDINRQWANCERWTHLLMTLHVSTQVDEEKENVSYTIWQRTVGHIRGKTETVEGRRPKLNKRERSLSSGLFVPNHLGQCNEQCSPNYPARPLMECGILCNSVRGNGGRVLVKKPATKQEDNYGS